MLNSDPNENKKRGCLTVCVKGDVQGREFASNILYFSIIVLYLQGRHGRAFLFSHAMNIVAGPKEDRHLTTGLHTVADIHCSDCHEVLGWKYERAYEASQKYKEGKFILEKSRIVKENWQQYITVCFMKFILYRKFLPI